MTLEALALADLYNLTQMAHVDRKKRGRVKPYPRPWKSKSETRSAPPTISQAQVRAELAARGH